MNVYTTDNFIVEVNTNYQGEEGICKLTLEFKDEDVIFARISTYKFDFGVCNQDALDIISSDTDACSLLLDIDEGGWVVLKKKLKVDTESWDMNQILHYVDTIEILPAYRGNGLTKNVLNNYCSLFADGGDLVALLSAPLQFTNMDTLDSLELEKLEQDKERAARSLMNYYKSLGFIQYDEEMVMYQTVNEERKI